MTSRSRQLHLLPHGCRRTLLRRHRRMDAINVNWDAVSGAASYKVTVKDGSNNITGSPKTVTRSGDDDDIERTRKQALHGHGDRREQPTGESDPSSPGGNGHPRTDAGSPTFTKRRHRRADQWNANDGADPYRQGRFDRAAAVSRMTYAVEGGWHARSADSHRQDARARRRLRSGQEDHRDGEGH